MLLDIYNVHTNEKLSRTPLWFDINHIGDSLSMNRYGIYDFHQGNFERFFNKLSEIDFTDKKWFEPYHHELRHHLSRDWEYQSYFDVVSNKFIKRTLREFLIFINDLIRAGDSKYNILVKNKTPFPKELLPGDSVVCKYYTITSPSISMWHQVNIIVSYRDSDDLMMLKMSGHDENYESLVLQQKPSEIKKIIKELEKTLTV